MASRCKRLGQVRNPGPAKDALRALQQVAAMGDAHVALLRPGYPAAVVPARQAGTDVASRSAVRPCTFPAVRNLRGSARAQIANDQHLTVIGSFVQQFLTPCPTLVPSSHPRRLIDFHVV